MNDLPTILQGMMVVLSVSPTEGSGVSDFANFGDGAAGGAVLGILRLLMGSTELARNVKRGERKAWQFAITQVVVVATLAAIGGVVAWAFTGRAGNFVTGFTSLGLLLLIAGLSLDTQKIRKDEGSGDV